MVDSIGHRMKFGVIAPSTNTAVQPEFDSLRPWGVTNHFARIHIPDNPVRSDEDFNQLMLDIRAELMVAIDRVVTCSPGAVIMGMSAETFWDGLEGSKVFHRNCEERAGVPVSMGSDACQAALRKYGDIRRIGVITPYMPLGEQRCPAVLRGLRFRGRQSQGAAMREPATDRPRLGAGTARFDRRGRRQPGRGHRPGRHQSRHGPGRGDRGILARQAGDRDQHGDLLVVAAPAGHRGQGLRLGQPDAGLLRRADRRRRNRALIGCAPAGLP